MKVSWPAQPGATGYRLYRAATANLADARLLETVTQRTQTSDQPGIGTAYYWLTAVDTLGESQFLGPTSVTIGEKAAGEPQIRFTGTPAPALLFPQLPALSAFPGTTVIRNLTVTAKALTATVTPAGATVSTVAMGENRWRLTINVPAQAVPGTRYTVTLAATGGAKPATAACTVTPVAVAGVLTRTGGTLTIDTAAAAGKPVTTLAWAGQGSVPVTPLAAAEAVCGSDRMIIAKVSLTYADGQSPSGMLRREAIPPCFLQPRDRSLPAGWSAALDCSRSRIVRSGNSPLKS